MWRRVLPALLLAACGGEQRQAAPAIWRAGDADTTLYLLPSMHQLPADVDWQGPAVARAIERSDALVLEVADSDDRDAQLAAFRRAAERPELPRVLDRVPREYRDPLRDLAGQAGVPLATLDGMATWGVALALAPAVARDNHVAGDHGVEAVLADRFRRAGKPVLALESSAAQYATFAGLSERAQRRMLTQLLDEAADPTATYAALLAAWSTGDEATMAAAVEARLADAPEFRAALLDRRNARWAMQLHARLRRPGTLLVAVGAAHLAGPGSVQARLARGGVRVERLATVARPR